MVNIKLQINCVVQKESKSTFSDFTREQTHTFRPFLQSTLTLKSIRILGHKSHSNFSVSGGYIDDTLKPKGAISIWKNVLEVREKNVITPISRKIES